MRHAKGTDRLFPEMSDGGNYYIPDGPSAPFAWYGGKAYYAKWIIDRFPKHRVYIEPFGGAANILLRKRPSDVEVFNDLDERVINFFRVLRSPEQLRELQRLTTLTPYSRKEFGDLAEMPEPGEPIERAWWFFVRCRQALGGIGMSQITASSWASSARTRRMMAEPVSKYLSAIEGLEVIAERFRTVLIECLPALMLVQRYDSDDVFFYCDPPYLPETRHNGEASTYGKEMSREDHSFMLESLRNCKGAVMISGYASELYDSTLKGWTRREMEGKAHLANSGQSRTEVIWMNW